ncbi:hypothetical protein ANRL4_00923 [Anaerolineae bacterium]|nr:hypothetical protein ANRL4_00923 [Anaerolineae bacterium]
MFARRIQANYDCLQEILRQFMRHADMTVALTVQVEGLVEQLQGGAWRGVGAEAFYAEMRDLILPALRRLEDALQFAGEGTGKIHTILREAEEEAARLFRGEGEKAGNVLARIVKTPSHLLPNQDGSGINEEEARELQDSLTALLRQMYPQWWHIMFESVNAEPDLAELISFLALMQSSNDFDRFLAGLRTNWFEMFIGQPLALFPEVWAESLKERDYVQSWQAFVTWFRQDGIGVLNDPAGVLIALENWLNGRGNSIDVLLAAAPIISVSAFRTILSAVGDKTAQEALEKVGRQLPSGAIRVSLDEIIGVLLKHGDVVVQRNLRRLISSLDPKSTEQLLRSLTEQDLLRLISQADLWDSLPSGASLQHMWGYLKSIPDIEPEHLGKLAYDLQKHTFSLEEGLAAWRVELNRGITLERLDPAVVQGKTGDWVEFLGKNQYRSYDAVGPIPIGVSFDYDSFTAAIVKHLNTNGLDVVVIDLTGLDANSIANVQSFITGLSLPTDKSILIFP